MELKRGTLQDYFYKSEEDLNLFPDGKNYVSYYKSFKDFLDREIHPEIKPVMSREDPHIYLNDHSEKHVAMVIEKATFLLSGIPDKDALTPYEIFILLTAIQIHDAGHLINANRDTHAIDTSKIINELDKNISVLERKIIFDVARAHSGKNDLIGAQKEFIDISGESVRFRLIAAILRFADELADGKARASNYLLKIDRLPVESVIFHTFSSCLDSFKINIESHEVNMTFCVNEEQVCNIYKKQKTDKKTGDIILEDCLLINEIYSRTLKTFNEALYYNRFIPAEMRISAIYVEIIFFKKDSSDLNDIHFFETIKYRIEEIGYPRLFSEDIFEICNGSLEDTSGHKLSGEYIKQQIEC
jgi:hypothetical protein